MRAALIGCGAVSKKHVHAISTTNGISLEVVCDSSGTNPYQAPFVENYLEIFDYNVDLAIVCTPPDTHKDIAITCMSHGCDVLIEKPLTLKESEARELLAATKALKKRVWEVKQYRTSPLIHQAKLAADSGSLGRVHQIIGRMHWCRPQEYFQGWRGQPGTDGGVFASQGCHLVDLMHYFGGPVSQIKADFWNVMDLPCEDSGVALLQYSSGTRGILELTVGARPKNIEASVTLLGTEGTISIGGDKLNEVKVWECGYERPPSQCSDLHAAYYVNLVRNPNCVVDISEAVATVELMSRIYAAGNAHASL